MNVLMLPPPNVTNFIEHQNTAQTDPAGGIRIVKVTGIEHTGLYMAELAPHRSVTAHIGHDRFIVRGSVPKIL